MVEYYFIEILAEYEASVFTALRDHIKCGNFAIRGIIILLN